MMTDIFTTFDLTIFKTLFTEWLLWIMPLWLLMPLVSQMWVSISSLKIILNIPLSIMKKQTNETTMTKLMGSQNLMTALFTLLIFINLWGIIPYTFSTTTHLLFTAIMGLPLWLGLILSSLVNNPYYFIAALLPSGAPNWLNPFLVYIEIISTSVRPLTLGFRLAANMSAGHIVLTLISIYLASAFFAPLYILLLLLLVNIGYMAFELGICFIQAFIFSLLLTLYANDHQ